MLGEYELWVYASMYALEVLGFKPRDLSKQKKDSIVDLDPQALIFLFLKALFSYANKSFWSSLRKIYSFQIHVTYWGCEPVIKS